MSAFGTQSIAATKREQKNVLGNESGTRLLNLSVLADKYTADPVRFNVGSGNAVGTLRFGELSEVISVPSEAVAVHAQQNGSENGFRSEFNGTAEPSVVALSGGASDEPKLTRHEASGIFGSPNTVRFVNVSNAATLNVETAGREVTVARGEASKALRLNSGNRFQVNSPESDGYWEFTFDGSDGSPASVLLGGFAYEAGLPFGTKTLRKVSEE